MKTSLVGLIKNCDSEKFLYLQKNINKLTKNTINLKLILSIFWKYLKFCKQKQDFVSN